MTTYTWLGTTSSDFNTASNWDSNGIALSGEGDLYISATATHPLTLASNFTVGSLYIEGTTSILGNDTLSVSSTLYLDANETLTIGSGTTISAGVVSLASGVTSAAISSGTLDVTGGGIELTSGQTLTLTGGIDATISNTTSTGTTALNGATVTITGSNSGTFYFDNVASGGTENVLNISDYWNVLKGIQNFGEGDAIYCGDNQVTYSNGALYVDNVEICDSITFAGTLTSSDFSMSSNGYYTYGGVNPCFMAGTLLTTPEGQIAVEQAVAGTVLLTADGRAARVRWLGKSTVSTRFGDAARVLPIRIRAGALGAALPARDLLVSPDHALLLDGVLVQAGALVNGVSIVREHDVPERFAYYHVEMDTHEVLLAEGAAAESYLDVSEALRFDNRAERPDSATTGELPYPRALSARQVPAALRARIAARARLFGAAAAA